jgi:toxin ParE1/3/4
MPRVDRSRLVEKDLLEIAAYIAQDNPSAAARWLDEMEVKFTVLGKQPLMGEAVDDIQPGLRRTSHGQYLIFFEPRENGVALVRIIHGARNIEDLL